MGVALAKYSEIDSIWIPSLEMNAEVWLEEDLAGIPPIGRNIPAKSKRWLGGMAGQWRSSLGPAYRCIHMSHIDFSKVSEAIHAVLAERKKFFESFIIL